MLHVPVILGVRLALAAYRHREKIAAVRRSFPARPAGGQPQLAVTGRAEPLGTGRGADESGRPAVGGA